MVSTPPSAKIVQESSTRHAVAARSQKVRLERRSTETRRKLAGILSVEGRRRALEEEMGSMGCGWRGDVPMEYWIRSFAA